MIASLTGAGGNNVAPVSENTTSGLHNDWLFGLSDGTGFPGDVSGGKFIGQRLFQSNSLYVRNVGGLTKLTDDGASGALILTGVTANNSTVVNSTTLQTLVPTMTDPTSGAAYAFGLALQFDVSTPGSLIVSCGLINNLSRADGAQMSGVIGANMSAYGTITGGWWSASVPINCQYWFMRWPLSLNHMRIHNYNFIQLG